MEHMRRIPQLRFATLQFHNFRTKLEKYKSELLRLYEAIQEAAQCGFIVDSSKIPTYGHVLASIPNLELHVIHLTRDSRAVAYSWQRKKPKLDQPNRQSYMRVHNYFHSAFEYNVENGLIQTLRGHAATYQHCRYEDFVANPNIVVKDLLTNIGVDCTNVVVPRELHGQHVHAIHVNPMLFQQGTILLKPDNEWQAAMSRVHKLEVSMLTLPWLLQYGYSPFA
jgi:hypothetical protein